MASLALGVKFIAASGGLGDIVDNVVMPGYVRAVGNLVDGKSYRYRAETADLSQWEWGTGVWTAASSTLARTSITLSSTGARVNFLSPPVVGIVPFPADILQFDDAMALTVGQQAQARANIGAASIAATRQKLAGNTTYFVRKDGSNANLGSTNTAGGAWLTLQFAADYISQNIDLAGFSVVVQVGDGTYAENLVMPGVVGLGRLAQGSAVIQGNAANHSAVIIQPAAGDAVTGVDTLSGWTVKNIQINAPGGIAVHADYNAGIYLDGVVFGAANIHAQATFIGSFVEFVNNPYVVAGNCAAHASAISGGQVVWQAAATCSFTGTPSVSATWLQIVGGLISCGAAFNGLTATGAGSAFTIDYGGILRTSNDPNPNAVLPSGLSVGTANIWPVQAGITYTNTLANVNAALGVTANGTAAIGQLPGTATNDNAAAGKVGEYVSATVATGAAVALTTGVVANVTSITLAAGDWDVWVNGYFNNTASTIVNAAYTTIANANNALDQTAGRFGVLGPLSCNATPLSVPAGPYRISLSAPTTIYFNAYAGFSGSTLSAWGAIQARRVR